MSIKSDHVVKIEFKIQLRKDAFNLVLGWVYRGHSTPEFATRLDQFGLNSIHSIKPPFSRRLYEQYLTLSIGVSRISAILQFQSRILYVLDHFYYEVVCLDNREQRKLF